MAPITLICFVLTIRQVPICPCKFNLILDSWRAVFLVLFPRIPLTSLFTAFFKMYFYVKGNWIYLTRIWACLYQQNLWALQLRNLNQREEAYQAWLKRLIYIENWIAGASSRETHAHLVNWPSWNDSKSIYHGLATNSELYDRLL